MYLGEYWPARYSEAGLLAEPFPKCEAFLLTERIVPYAVATAMFYPTLLRLQKIFLTHCLLRNSQPPSLPKLKVFCGMVKPQ